MLDAELADAVRAEVRRYLTRTVGRSLPILAAIAALVALVVLVPDQSRTSASSTAGQVPGGNGGQPLPTTGQPSPGATLPPGQRSGIPGSPGQVGGPNPTGGTTTGGVPQSSGGVSRTGIKCANGVRQFTWTAYAPPCTPKFTGANGGATSRGVTATTITLTLRKTTDWDSLASATNTDKFAPLAHDIGVLVDYFNKQYELYGRHVIVKTFDGKGSFVAEGANQDQAAANADAQTAADLGAFVDGFPFAAGTYADAEASRGIIHFSPGNGLAAYRSNSPYRYGMPAGAVNEVQGAGVAAFVCQRLAKMNAIFAGDATTRARTRKFAVLEPEQPDFAGGSAVLAHDAQSECGVAVKVYKYSSDVSSEPQQAAQITTQMQADQDTTVIMLTDPVMVQYMTASATSANYNPEWLFTVLPAALARQANSTQMKAAMQLNPWEPPVEDPQHRTCYRVYKLADPNGTPQSSATGLDTVCSTLLALFGALQQAGPDLTPTNFNRGWFSLPPSTSASDFGRWSFAANQWSPASTFSVSWWNGGVTSKYDGGTGEFDPCAGLIDKPYLRPSLGSGQPTCFGH